MFPIPSSAESTKTSFRKEVLGQDGIFKSERLGHSFSRPVVLTNWRDYWMSWEKNTQKIRPCVVVVSLMAWAWGDFCCDLFNQDLKVYPQIENLCFFLYHSPRLVAGILWFKGLPRWWCSVYPLSFSLCQCCPVAWQCQIARHLTPNSKRIGSLNPSPRDHFSRKPSGFVGPLILRHTSPYKTTSLDLCQNRRKPNLVDDFEKQSFCNVLYQFKFVSGPPFEAKIAPENWCFAN